MFKGALGLSEGTLRGRMIERFGETPPLARAADVAAGLEELYRERGYLRARCAWRRRSSSTIRIARRWCST